MTETAFSEVELKVDSHIQVHLLEQDVWASMTADEAKEMSELLLKASESARVRIREKANAGRGMIVSAMGTLMAEDPKPKIGPKGGSGASDAVWTEDPEAMNG